MFKKVLIANRGEIAVRIAATLQQMGITAVAVYSDPDRTSPHVSCADEAYPLEGKTSAETYLRGAKIIDLARRHGVDAIHPGFGFLSENEDFAAACADADLVFIGPSPQVIRDMGDKIIAKEKFSAAGVPVVPGWSGDAEAGPETLMTEARRIGFPVLIKAAAGGGGKGMRVVNRPEDFLASADAARREASAAFGDGRVFIEKYISRPRHVEFQIFGDSHGNVVHLFERECSIQRRHQKIIEESPSPALTPELRRKMGDAAVRAAKAIGYTNAGTVEFIIDPDGNFYFLEVNTRLQVEHPVTEMVTRHDLVRAQVLVAAGERLPFTQESLRQEGHAFECRVYAEDPARGFLPSTGTLLQYRPPVGPGIRVDSGVARGSQISVYYDPMLAKLIVHDTDRNAAIGKMRWALHHFVALGVITNIEFLSAVFDHAEFRAGRMHTHFLEEHKIAVQPPASVPDDALIAAALAASNGPGAASFTPGPAQPEGPWQRAGLWRNV